tara:strand:+ start:156380 stop:157711 length:1332 start_codon:yes stop_codon:yes gene_type:complete
MDAFAHEHAAGIDPPPTTVEPESPPRFAHGGQNLGRGGPIRSIDRIETLDVIRGFAVLGILVMNIQSFSMVGATYLNPTATGIHQGAEYLIWYVCHLLADSKFMSIFSMLFGAGIVLMAQRQIARDGAPGRLHYRRMLGLLCIGLFHAYIFWYGDILVPYAVCGSLVYPLWRLPGRWLVAASATLMFIGALIIVLFDWGVSFLSAKELTDVMTSWQPTDDQIRKEIAAYRGPWTQQFAHRAESAIGMQLFVLPTMIGWHIAGLMVLGMALFKSGFLSGDRSVGSLAALMVIGLAGGLPLIAWGIHANEQAGWTLRQSMFLGTLPNYFGSTLVAIGYIAAIGLLMKTVRGKAFLSPLAPVGRMALTNYLMQTVICTTIFYGHGFALFATLNRLQQVGIVVCIWAFQIMLSRIWMKNYRFGPIEYLWRIATYGRTAKRVRRQSHS